MRTKDLIIQFEYNYWAIEKVLKAAKTLQQRDLIAMGTHSYGSILGLLSHIASALNMWLQRCRDGVSPTTMRYPEPSINLDELHSAWETEKRAFLGYLDSLHDNELDLLIHYKGFSGREFSNTLWHILIQIVNHRTSHRAEIAGKLTELGSPPGYLDFIIYLRD